MSYDRDRNETVVVTDRGGSGGVIAGVLIALAVILGLFFFGGNLFTGDGAGDTTNVAVDMPEVEVPAVEAPDVDTPAAPAAPAAPAG